jgi:hypothetical protein
MRAGLSVCAVVLGRGAGVVLVVIVLLGFEYLVDDLREVTLALVGGVSLDLLVAVSFADSEEADPPGSGDEGEVRGDDPEFGIEEVLH